MARCVYPSQERLEEKLKGVVPSKDVRRVCRDLVLGGLIPAASTGRKVGDSRRRQRDDDSPDWVAVDRLIRRRFSDAMLDPIGHERRILAHQARVQRELAELEKDEDDDVA